MKKAPAIDRGLLEICTPIYLVQPVAQVLDGAINQRVLAVTTHLICDQLLCGSNGHINGGVTDAGNRLGF